MEFSPDKTNKKDFWIDLSAIKLPKVEMIVLSKISEFESGKKSFILFQKSAQNIWITFVHELLLGAVVSSHFSLETEYPGAHESVALPHLPGGGAGPLLGAVPPLDGQLSPQLRDRGVVGPKLVDKILKSSQLCLLLLAKSGRIEILDCFHKGWSELFNCFVTD